MNKTAEVNAFMDKLDHPLKAEVQAVRECREGIGEVNRQGELSGFYLALEPSITNSRVSGLDDRLGAVRYL